MVVVDQRSEDGPTSPVRQQWRHVFCPELPEFLVVLEQSSSARHVYHLQSATHPKCRKEGDPGDERSQHLLEIKPGVGSLQLRMWRARVQAGIEISTPWQEQPIKIEHKRPERVHTQPKRITLAH